MSKYIEDAFKSLQNQKSPTLRIDLFSRIEQKINQENLKVTKLLLGKVAVAAFLILIINMLGLNAINTINKNQQTKEYPYTTNYNIYL